MTPPPELPAWPDGRIRAPEDFEGAEAVLDDYGDLESILHEAEVEGVVDEPAASEERALAGEANHVRDEVISERLWLLGYLPHPEILTTSEHEGERDAALSAIARFQADAGLKPDRWAGPRTWDALQRLVTFETPTDSAAYWTEGAPMPALARSVRLRLWALGFLEAQPDAGEASDRTSDFALSRFVKMLKRFRVLPFDASLPPLEEQIALLFDQDLILTAVASTDSTVRLGNLRWVFKYLSESQERRSDTDPEVGGFLARLARIELWLLGFDVEIAATAQHPVVGFTHDAERDPKLAAALDEFWDLLSRPARHLRRHITPELFKAMADPGAQAHPRARSRWTEPDYSRAVVRDLRTRDEVEAAWAKGRSLGMRLWDGVKRLWRWIVRGIRKVVEVGLNLARAFMRFASKSYQIVRRAMRAMAGAARQYGAHEIDSHGPTRLLIGGDGDLVSFVLTDQTADEAGRAVLALEYFGASFALACRILATVLRAVRTAVASAGIALVGWARLLWVLVQCYRDIRPAYLEFRALPDPATA